MKQELLYNAIAGFLTLAVRDHNQVVAPLGVKLTIMRGSETIIDSVAVNPDPDGCCRYAADQRVTGELGDSYQAVWKYILAGQEKIRVNPFSVVRQILEPLINDDDLINECGLLEHSKFYEIGQVDGPASTYIVDNQLLGKSGFKGGVISFLSGAAINMTRVISMHSGTRISWEDPIDLEIVVGDRFSLERTFQASIDSAWEEILIFIEGKGNRPSLVIGADVFKVPHKFLALEKILRTLAVQENKTEYWNLAESYKSKYETAMGNINFQYDTDEDGQPDEIRDTVVRFNR